MSGYMNKQILQLLLLSSSLLLAMPVSAAPNGEALYDQNCASCHGYDGHGGVGIPLALPAFLESVPDAYLSKTIRYGREGRVMPPFKYLSDAQIDAIVKHVRGFSKAKAATLTLGSVQGDKKNGARLYTKYCAACHGAQGEGGTGTGVTFSRPRDLPVIAPALRDGFAIDLYRRRARGGACRPAFGTRRTLRGPAEPVTPSGKHQLALSSQIFCNSYSADPRENFLK